jgi:hypothetical protein
MTKFSGSGEHTLVMDEKVSKKLKSLSEKLSGGREDDDTPIEDRKAYKAFAKKFGTEGAEIFLNKTRQELEDVISYNVLEISKAKDEVETTPSYISAAQALKDLKGGLKEVTDPMKSAISLATLIINQKYPDKEA